jgi:hypothetical protein
LDQSRESADGPPDYSDDIAPPSYSAVAKR